MAVLPCPRDLREHVLIEVAFGVAVVHLDLVDKVDNLME